MEDPNNDDEFNISVPSLYLNLIGNQEEATKFAKCLKSCIAKDIEESHACEQRAQANDKADAMGEDPAGMLPNGVSEHIQSRNSNIKMINGPENKTSLACPLTHNVNSKRIIINIQHVDIAVVGKNNTVVSSDSNAYTDLRYIIVNNPSIFPNIIKRSGSCSGRRYELIMSKSRHLTDNGHSNKLLRLIEIVLHESGKKRDVDLQVIALLQRAVFYVYGNRLETADGELDKAIELASKSVNTNFLLGKCYTYKAYVKLYQTQLEEALEYLNIARNFVAFYESGQEKATICYLYGCVYMKMAGKTDTPSPDLESKALRFFALDARHAQEDPDKEVGVKELQYGIFKQITVHLRTYTKKSYEFLVAVDEISKAKELLDYFELHLWKNASTAAKIHFASLKADYFFRNKSFERAFDILKVALKDAQDVGYKPLLDMVNSRIDSIQTYIT